MANMNEETIYAGQGTANQPKVDNKKDKKIINPMVAKLLASAGIGMVAGAGLSFATIDRPEEPTEETADGVQPQENVEESQSEEEQAQHGPSLEERIAALEEKERIREQNEHNRQNPETENQQQETDNHRPVVINDDDPVVVPTNDSMESDYLQEHDVKIESIHEVTLDDGSIVHLYIGEADGHEAAFLDDGEYIVAAVIDVDDNGDVEDDDVLDLQSYRITTQQMSEVCENAEHEAEIHVVSVQHDVEVDGQLVDVAEIEVDGQRVILLDEDRDYIVDVAVSDLNQDGVITEDEVEDFRPYNMPMPTEDDLAYTSPDSIPVTDYTNNADVDVYEV